MVMRYSLKTTRSVRVGLCILAIVTTSKVALATDVASFDNGDRILVPFHWKIEHRAGNPFENFARQLGTPEGRKIIGTIATLAGLDPATATVAAAAIPLPKLDAGATDNRGIIAAPAGMTICNAKPIGKLEASHASWSSSIVRNGNQDGLGYYTSVGTGQGTTHRIMGDFYVEFVKPVDGWEAKYGCLPDKKIVWNLHD